jgi:hypothetical protein
LKIKYFPPCGSRAARMPPGGPAVHDRSR